MTAEKIEAQTDANEDSLTLSEEYEILEPRCVLRFPGVGGVEVAITLRPGESMSTVLSRMNVTRPSVDLDPAHAD